MNSRSEALEDFVLYSFLFNNMSLFSSLFGDPTISVLRSYQKDLLKIKKIRRKIQKTIMTIEAVKTKTKNSKVDSLRSSSPISPARIRSKTAKTSRSKEENEQLKNNQKKYIDARETMVQTIRFEALALHERERAHFGQEFHVRSGSTKVWNMIPFDVQLVGALTSTAEISWNAYRWR